MRKGKPRGTRARSEKTEFSKAIFTCISIATTAVVIFSCVMMYRTGDLSPLAYLTLGFRGTGHSDRVLLPQIAGGERN